MCLFYGLVRLGTSRADGNRTSGVNRNSVVVINNGTKGDAAHGSVVHSLKVGCGAGLPAGNLLLSRNIDSSSRSVGQPVGNNAGVGGTNVGNVGSLAAALELGSKDGDGDGNQDGRQRLYFEKTVRIWWIPPY